MQVGHAEHDALIGELIAAAVAQLDGPNGWLGRFLVEQTWDYKIDAFPEHGSCIKLPLWPVQSLTSISYVDTDGNSQTWGAAYGKSWPATRDQKEAVTLRGVFGYADSGSSPEDYGANVPDDIRFGIGMQVKLWYETGGLVFGDTPLELFPVVKNALMAKKVWRV